MQSDRERSEADLALKQKDLDALGEQRRRATQGEKELEARAEQLEELLKDRDGALESSKIF